MAAVERRHAVQEGDFVVWDVYGDSPAFVEVKSNRGRLKLGKNWYPVQQLLGAPYGTAFEPSADGKSLQKRALRGEWSSTTETARDNSRLVDDGGAQALRADDIAELRAGGARGEAIIDALAAASATFENKTEFAQEKYRRRKAKKYCVYGVARRPTARSVCEAYFVNQPSKIHSLRVDTLSMLLTYANVGAHANVLVVESCSGLVTGAVAERLGGYGSVLAVPTGGKQFIDIVRMFNFDAAAMDALSWAALPDLMDAAGGAQAEAAAEAGATGAAAEQPGHDSGATAANGDTAPGAAASAPTDAAAQPNGEPTDVAGADAAARDASAAGAGAGAGAADAAAAPAAGGPQAGAAAMDVDSSAVAAAAGGGEAGAGARGGPPRGPRRMPRHATPAELHASLARGFDSFILAVPEVDTLATLRVLLPLLPPSTPFVAYSCWPQPLLEALLALQAAKDALCLQLHESWWRQHQVLPARTHPHMTTSGTGGYFISGVTVQRPSGGPASGAKGAGGGGQRGPANKRGRHTR